MKKLIYIPGFIWFLPFLSVLVIIFGILPNAEEQKDLIFTVFHTLLIAIPAWTILWYLAVYYFSFSEIKHHNPTEKFLVTLSCSFIGISRTLTEVFEVNEKYMIVYSVFTIINLLLLIYVLICTAKLAQKYLYARSLWFIVIELIFPFIGMLTLTPSLTEEKKERLKESNIQ